MISGQGKITSIGSGDNVVCIRMSKYFEKTDYVTIQVDDKNVASVSRGDSIELHMAMNSKVCVSYLNDPNTLIDIKTDDQKVVNLYQMYDGKGLKVCYTDRCDIFNEDISKKAYDDLYGSVNTHYTCAIVGLTAILVLMLISLSNLI